MFCKNCGAPLEDGRSICPVCGAQNDAGAQEPVSAEPVTPETAPEEPVPEEPVPEEPVPEEPERNACTAPEEPVPEEPTQYAYTAPEAQAPVVRPVKKRRGKVVLVVVLLILALLAGAAVSVFVFKYPASVYNWARNFIAKTFYQTNEYYRMVETENLRALTGSVRVSGEQLKALGQSAEPELPRYREEKLQLRFNSAALGRELNDKLQDDLGLDLSWLRNVGLYRSQGTTGEGTGATATLYLNDVDLLDASFVVSADGNEIYMKVPAISDSYAMIDLSEYSEMVRYELSALEGQSYATPDLAKMADLIDRYTDIFVSRVTDVEKGSAELRAGGVTKEVSTLVVRADGETLRGIGVAMLESLENDLENHGDFEAFVSSIMEMSPLYTEYPELQDEILGETKESIAQSKEELQAKKPEELTHSLVMTLYLDNMGRILGRDIEVFDKDKSVFLLRYTLITDGSDFGLYLEIRQEAFEEGETDAMLFECSGKKDDGGVNGTMSFSFKPNYEDALKKMFDLNFEISKKNDATRMSLLLIPSEALQDQIIEEALTEDAPEATEKLFRNLRARLVFEVKGTTQNMDLALLNGSEELLALAREEYEVQPFDVSIPTDALDINDWADTISYAKLMELEQTLMARLAEAGMPMSFLYSLFA